MNEKLSQDIAEAVSHQDRPLEVRDMSQHSADTGVLNGPLWREQRLCAVTFGEGGQPAVRHREPGEGR